VKFLSTPETEPSKLDPLIEDVIMEMKGLDTDSEEYQTALTSLRVLYEAKATEPKRKELDPNTVASVAGSLAGIGLILLFEMRGVITSKSMNFVPKPKI
jgi:hypothetical protein